MNKGMMANSDGIALPNKTTMKKVKEGNRYKYLGEKQTDGKQHQKKKKKGKIEYYRLVRKILEMKLNDGKVITGINTWTISLLPF